MTAFARTETNTSLGTLVWEIRSLNHRYLEVSFRLPEAFSKFELALREQVRSQLARGKIDINLKYQPPHNSSAHININEHIAKDVLQAHEALSKLSAHTTTINLSTILQWPGVINAPQQNLAEQEAEVLRTFGATLTQLVENRKREGKAIQEMILQRLKSMQTYIEQIKVHYPQQIQAQRERLLNRFNEAKLSLDPGRLEQEMLIFIQKIDIAEELDRLKAHIKEIDKTIQGEQANGRRLDFLMQELNREANTLAAKSISTEITLAAVELKVLIDQLREQIQNVE